MASLITLLSPEFAAALPDGGKLAGLDVGTRTIGLAICDAGWHFAGSGRDRPPHQVYARIWSASRFRRARACGRAGRRPAPEHGRERLSTHAVGPRLRPQSRAARASDPAVGRALVDPGGRAGDDRGRRQPRPPRRESRRACRRAHPPGRDRCAGQSGERRLGDALVDLLSIDSLNDSQVATILDRTEHWFAENRAGQTSDLAPRQDAVQPVLRKFDAHADVVRDRRASPRRIGRHPTGRAILGEEGRDPRGYGADAQRDAARRAGHPPQGEWRAGRGRLDHGLPGDQRRRRHQRASDPGAARRRDHPPPVRPDRGPQDRDLRRYPRTAGSRAPTPSCCRGWAPRCASPARPS